MAYPTVPIRPSNETVVAARIQHYVHRNLNPAFARFLGKAIASRLGIRGNVAIILLAENGQVVQAREEDVPMVFSALVSTACILANMAPVCRIGNTRSTLNHDHVCYNPAQVA
ncbi:hypothetical protein CC1G_01464 [Coprinopsis cinerea okayama7|uniref:Uncharacterized protein n=1 Tax=Coprinopsis cinerea (strain Okayama-7 / 130 / ATCC MYA-4618 / FGSC 9003) TaxID=240176 RepID=A8NYX6_COPC7|nr:hypothetical protein CC1G_01464 [Coprinopsis cinerea okayama7\|eukprot:XP_001837552.2 hypothetical protein CC1G_01464 [Coprinopsis cinerea okayama7\